jgi:hypothetical protein
VLRLAEADHADPLNEHEAAEYLELLAWLRTHLRMPSPVQS